MKTQTLTVAVLALIQELEQAGDSFTAHNITKRLRDLVNAEQLFIADFDRLDQDEIDELGYQQEVPHEQVRDVVRELYDNDLINFSRSMPNGSYYLYSPKSVAPTGNVIKTMPVVAPLKTSVNKIVMKSGQKTKTRNSTGSGLSGTTTTAILDYLNSKKSKNQRPTLKNIQSRLKGTSVSLGAIQQFLTLYGFSITPGPTLSQTQVVL